MSFAKEGIEWLANVFRQSIPQLQAQGDILRRHYYLLSDQMNSLAQGTTGWEGQASAVCQQLWEDLGPKLILQVAALNELSEALSRLASEFEHIHDNPSQAAYEMGLPVAGLSLGGTIAADGAIGAGIGAAEFLTAGLATIVVAGVVIFITEQQAEQNALTATQQVVAATTATAPGSVEEATRAVPPIENPTDEGGRGDPGRNSPKWPRYVVFAILAAGVGIGAFIAYELTHGQPVGFTQADVDYVKDRVSGVSDADIRAMLAENLSPEEVVELLKAGFRLSYVKQLKTSGFSNSDIVKVGKAGYTLAEIHILLSAGCTKKDLTDYADAGIPSSAITIVCQRIQQAQASPNGKDQYGVAASDWPPILGRLAKLLVKVRTTTDKNTAKGYQLEATTVINEISVLVNAGNIPLRPDNSPLTDIDIETSCAIIEVTRRSSGKLQQIQTLQNDTRVNPLHKQVILFAPSYVSAATDDITALGVPVIKTQADLDSYLKNLKCNNPGGGS